MNILGVNAYHPDSSAAIVVNGKLIAACEEERFRRIKHFAGFPREAVRYCLFEAGVSLEDIDYIAIPRNPNARIFKKIFYGLKIPGLARKRRSSWKKTFDVKKSLSSKAKIIKIEHHRAHLASSFFVSDFDRAFLFSMDALGDFASTMWATGRGNKIQPLGEVTFPHSLGFYYTAIVQYLGFLHFGDEYKVMGLASYGEPAFEDEFKKILRIRKNRFELNLRYFLHHRKHINMDFENGPPEIGLLFSPYLEKRLGRRRKPGEPIEKRHKDIAFSLQKRLEEVLTFLINTHSPKGTYNLCLSGGVSQNSVANGRLLNETRFKDIYVPPAPGDAGLAVGAAYYLWNHILGKPRTFRCKHAYWGPAYGDFESEAFTTAGCKIEKIEDKEKLCKEIASEISKGKIIGWFQERMEFGPRALGNRSILVDPRREDMKNVLNKRIKYREPFRPFAPSILEEHMDDYFERSFSSPFMSFVYKIKEGKKDLVPAVRHVDGTARLQTVNKDMNPRYQKLIEEFYNITGVPMLLNTSFNENEPIVCSPKEAIDCFLRTGMDILVLDSYVMRPK